ncbi:hypothetical protein Apa02nite_019930 [Actinoplanes palleronii]|uniref:Uncharacterized protein n=1 Tax=Actinoplanes palleronii TaxID=113570 RepID=A0ABQ4B5H5_9ACTN|nr:hypothetical protein Apa02nite_019930 [Actinoplanes palleronii]
MGASRGAGRPAAGVVAYLSDGRDRQRPGPAPGAGDRGPPRAPDWLGVSATPPSGASERLGVTDPGH